MMMAKSFYITITLLVSRAGTARHNTANKFIGMADNARPTVYDEYNKNREALIEENTTTK